MHIPLKMTFKLFFLSFFLGSFSLSSFCQWNLDSVNGGKMIIKSIPEFTDHYGFTDNEGGTIQVYKKTDFQYAPGITRYSIHLQHTDTAGQLLWGNADSGKVLYQTFDDYENLELLSAKSDHAGGAYILWWGKAAPEPAQVYGFRLQHIDNNGNAEWSGNGAVLFETTDNSYPVRDAKLTVDDAGNAFAVWRNTTYLYGNLYAQKINNTGALLWGDSGIPLSLTSLQGEFMITADNTGGLFIVFEDGRNSVYDAVSGEFDHLEIFAQRINTSGQSVFGDAGIIAAGAVGDSMILVSENATTNFIQPDGNGGCYFVYGHFIGVDGGDVLLQRLTAVGGRPWGNFGVLATGEGQGVTVYDYRLYKKPNGGIAGLYSLYEGSFNDLPLHLQHFNQDGSVQYAVPIKVAEISYFTTSSEAAQYDAFFYEDDAASVVFLGSGDSLYIKRQQVAADGVLLYDLNGKTMMYQTTKMVQIIPGTTVFNNLLWQDTRNYNSFSQERDAFITKLNREPSATRRTIYSVNNGNWNNPSTWLNNIIPGPDDIVAVSHTVNVTVNTTCYSLSIEPGGNIVVAAGIDLTILH